jgi:hypothetical protein
MFVLESIHIQVLDAHVIEGLSLTIFAKLHWVLRLGMRSWPGAVESRMAPMCDDSQRCRGDVRATADSGKGALGDCQVSSGDVEAYRTKG